MREIYDNLTAATMNPSSVSVETSFPEHWLGAGSLEFYGWVELRPLSINMGGRQQNSHVHNLENNKAVLVQYGHKVAGQHTRKARRYAS